LIEGDRVLAGDGDGGAAAAVDDDRWAGARLVAEVAVDDVGVRAGGQAGREGAGLAKVSLLTVIQPLWPG
jgi:hypothetical protein